uniref:Septin-type G domain-containing protein n=1 Tax=Timema tahoe TaxID=61484 RepID=A0A7R9IPM2_9NEOP|nr:unnamed protein product [Timema tahoe]
MGKTTSAERMRKRKTVKEAKPNEYKSHIVKERQRDRKRLENMKRKETTSTRLMVARRLKETKRKRKYRQKKKENSKIVYADAMELGTLLGSYSCVQSLVKVSELSKFRVFKLDFSNVYPESNSGSAACETSSLDASNSMVPTKAPTVADLTAGSFLLVKFTTSKIKKTDISTKYRYAGIAQTSIEDYREEGEGVESPVSRAEQQQVGAVEREKTHQTVKLDASTVEIEERGVKLRLTVVDTPGYGDAIDNSDR